MPFMAPVIGVVLDVLAGVGTAVGAGGLGLAGAEIVGAALIGATAYGVASTIGSAQDQAKAAKEQSASQAAAMAAFQDQQTGAKAQAEVSAQQAITDRRRSILASGGQTDVTGGSALLQPSTGTKKTILGS